MRRAAAMPPLSSFQAAFFESFLSFASNTIRPVRRPRRAAPSSTSVSPFLPPPLGALGAGVRSRSRRGSDAIRSTRVVHALLEGEALARCRRSASAAPARRRPRARLQLDHLRAGAASMRFAVRLALVLLALVERLEAADDGCLEVRRAGSRRPRPRTAGRSSSAAPRAPRDSMASISFCTEPSRSRRRSRRSARRAARRPPRAPSRAARAELLRGARTRAARSRR